MNVVHFFKELHAPVLEATVWFTSASGKTCWKNMTLTNNAASTAEEMIDDVLYYVTEFVKQQWFRIEVCTPTLTSYGKISGGHGRMLVTK